MLPQWALHMLWGRGSEEGAPHSPEHLLALPRSGHISAIDTCEPGPGPQAEGEDDSIASSGFHLQSGIGTCSWVPGVAQMYEEMEPEETEQAAHNRLFSWDIPPNIPTAHVHICKCSLTRVLTRHTWVLSAQRTRVDAWRGEPGLEQEGPVEHLGSGCCQKLYQLGTSPRGRTHENPKSALSELQPFHVVPTRWCDPGFQRCTSKGRSCVSLPPPEPAPMSGPLPESYRHMHTHNLKGAATTVSHQPSARQRSSRATENAILPPKHSWAVPIVGCPGYPRSSMGPTPEGLLDRP